MSIRRWRLHYFVRMLHVDTPYLHRLVDELWGDPRAWNTQIEEDIDWLKQFLRDAEGIGTDLRGFAEWARGQPEHATQTLIVRA
eukprot:8377488-Pyramimonas_sp.AAC.1